MFCPNCGAKCRDNDLFCANCGTCLPDLPAHAAVRPVADEVAAAADEQPSRSVASTFRQSAAVAASRNENRMDEGVILTNLRALSRKLNTGIDTLQRLLAAYAEASLGHGIRYRLVDVSDYGYLNPDAQGRRAGLSPNDSWVEHIALLADYYRYGRSTTEEESNYLFIVGGDDIIPMPTLPNHVYRSLQENCPEEKFDDADVDTDIPYAYLLGQRTYPLFASGELFNYRQYYYVGRLPLAADATADDLAGYLHRAAQRGDGIPVTGYFGLSNLLWSEDSQSVCAPLRGLGLPTNAARYAESVLEADGFRFPVASNGLFNSGPISLGNIDRVFDPQAAFYYLNLHGSSNPTEGGFIGEFRPRNYCSAIEPHWLAAAECDNIVVTEACYGAKYKKFHRDRTMLLAAVNNRTLLYLGSSRIAFCNTKYPIDNSDRLANVFMSALFDGYSAGEALFRARQSFFEYDQVRLHDQQLVTIVEFNLFGDPHLHAAVAGGGAHKSLPAEASAMTARPVHIVSQCRCLYRAVGHAPASLLEQVRERVDDNLLRIRSVVDKELYERLGVEPRKLDAIFRNRFTDGEEFYALNYDDGDGKTVRLHTAVTDLAGKIKTIISTK